MAGLGSLLACGRSCTSDHAGGSPAEGGASASAPLHVVPLGRAKVRLQQIALDPTHVYVSTLFGGARRVSKDGGALEILSGAAFPPPGVLRDPRHAYFNGVALDPSRTAEVDGYSYGLDASGVHRMGADGGRETLARSLFTPPSIDREVLVMDDARVYWLEAAASAVLSVPKAGGPVAFVCEAWVPVHDELALSGDRIYLLDIGGDLSSAPKAGGDLSSHGSLGSGDLGSNRNGVWATASGNALYIVSDASGDASNGPEPTFDGRILRVDLPSIGAPQRPHVHGLIFGANVWITAHGAPEPADLKRATETLEPLRALLSAGKLPITVVLEAGPGAAAATTARMEAIEASLKASFGPGVATERVVDATTGADAGTVASTAYVGIDRRFVPSIFAP
jgi:hypothetical protein